MAITTIIHLELLDKNEHYYFGSLKALTDMFDKDAIGITYGSLRSYFSLLGDKDDKEIENKPLVFKNKKCIIRKGAFIQTKTNRGQGRRNKPVEQP